MSITPIEGSFFDLEYSLSTFQSLEGLTAIKHSGISNTDKKLRKKTNDFQ